MEIELSNGLSLAGLHTRRGRIVSISEEGEIMVEGNSEDLPVPCDFLRTSAGALPALHLGAAVLYAFDEISGRGYVLGLIQKYRAPLLEANGRLAQVHTEHESRELKFNARERIEFRCGQSALLLRQDGSIILKGSDITSRASGLNKIKGAAVKIN